MEFLQEIFGEGVDLAAVASGAGIFGGGASAITAMMFSGVVVKFLIRTLFTGVLTGGGFLFLLHYLGFQIVPPDDLKDRIPSFGQSFDGSSTEEMARVEDEDGKRVYRVKSPFRS